ncbi:hypothetical protein [Streptomyces sp. SCSIO ZS0520]|uniref:hypothetical protein n=1 Tax=Streptomyces sp. SCSIO ZS0520 TaxID=2892996 RepID=UPI0021D93F23|nr:hypothetical protein [Streptomyces sp. SCSIO ZS0520]
MPALKQARGLAVLTLSAACVLATAVPASAGRDNQPSKPPKESPSDEIGSQVSFTYRSSAKSGKPMAPAGGNWSPPACWFEPKYNPKDFEKELASHNYGGGSAGTDIHNEYFEETDGEYHQGDKGAWYKLVKNPNASYEEYGNRCRTLRLYEWVGPADPPPPGSPVITPEILAGLAYNRTELPTPPVKLSPDPGRLKVNLPTKVAFEGGLDRVSVTASIDAMGVDLAATTVATPKQLRLEAGTEFADPQTCTYDLVKSGGTYTVDSGDSGCLLTYRKSSGNGTYDLNASITWDVTWNPTAGPDGAPVHDDLPDGETENDIPVTVKEIQSVNR